MEGPSEDGTSFSRNHEIPIDNNFQRSESRHLAFRVISRKLPKCPTNPSGTLVPEPTARVLALAVSAHTRLVSSENMASTSAVNASVRRPLILDLSRYAIWILSICLFNWGTILIHSAAPLKHHNGKEPCDRFVRKGSGTGLGLYSWHGVWDGRSDLSLEGISKGRKDLINYSMDFRTIDRSSTQKLLFRIDLVSPCYCRKTNTGP
ncbi:hypothetical protein VTL71DRAFT_607 [Oculimacula yallundae]|uniref:Uncharacterized protein n=1 Tax=Oculimacula yallundae TaxID=86028 RepID=A0ABR4D2U8_9HELO